ncbi:hypothetical protein C8J56DRAFT_1159051 [Mycena floridula]|nr:hypothetical protein C8J56DRAFT_1159051 [Mycena floridula]
MFSKSLQMASSKSRISAPPTRREPLSSRHSWATAPVSEDCELPQNFLSYLHQLVDPDDLSKESPMPLWVNDFEAGARGRKEDTPAAAQTLVNRYYWSEGTRLAQLAQHFCWMGCETRRNRTHIALVSFAFEVHVALKQTPPRLGDDFLFHLRECALSLFKTCWDPNSDKGITFKYGPSLSFVASAQSLGCFIGELFHHGLMVEGHIYACLQLLLQPEGNTVEHLQAIHYIVSYSASSWLWISPDQTPNRLRIDQFTQAFMRPSGQEVVRWSTSLLGKPLSDQREATVRVVLDLVWLA